MHLEEIRDNLADLIAQAALDGRPLSVCTYAHALDLGINVSEIEAHPHAHIITQENPNHG